jgi:hypothetical protein
MLRTMKLLALAAPLMLSCGALDLWAYGARHVGYTHVGPHGAYHAGRTVGYGPRGFYGGAHVGGYGRYGGYHYGGYHYGGYHGYGYRGFGYVPGAAFIPPPVSFYGPSPYAAYDVGAFRPVGVYAGARAGVYRRW